MTSRQSTHEANLRKAGWRRVGVWFSPEDLARLFLVRNEEGLTVSEQEAIRWCVRLGESQLTGQPMDNGLDKTPTT